MTKVSNISRRRRSAQTEGGADYTAKREELVRIAARLFKEQGYNATKLADIAREAGLDRATIYYYVGSKEELFRETVEGVLDVNMAEAERLIADDSLSWLDRLHAIYIRLMVSYEENYPATFVYIQEQMHQVGAEELGGTQQHRAIKTGTEVADGRAGRHGDQQGEEQHPQLAGAGIAQ